MRCTFDVHRNGAYINSPGIRDMHVWRFRLRSTTKTTKNKWKVKKKERNVIYTSGYHTEIRLFLFHTAQNVSITGFPFSVQKESLQKEKYVAYKIPLLAIQPVNAAATNKRPQKYNIKICKQIYSREAHLHRILPSLAARGFKKQIFKSVTLTLHFCKTTWFFHRFLSLCSNSSNNYGCCVVYCDTLINAVAWEWFWKWIIIFCVLC